jgi:SAM-dependent methyltransferase
MASREVDWKIYWKNNHWWRRLGARLFNHLTYMNMPEIDGSVLEVGCGLSKGHGKYPCWIGVDRERIVKPTVIADASFLPFRNHIFKLVYSFGLIEHLGDSITNALKEMHRVADLVYFSVPRKDGLFDKLHHLFQLLNHQWLFPKEQYYSGFPLCKKVRRNLLGCVDLYMMEELE